MSDTMTDEERAVEINRVTPLLRAEGGAVETMLLDEIEHLRKRRDTAHRAMQKARAEVDRKERLICELQERLHG